MDTQPPNNNEANTAANTPRSPADNQAIASPGAPRPLRLGLRIALEYTDRVNVAMQHNGVPLVDAIRITSTSELPLDDLTIELALDNGDAEPWAGGIARLEPAATASIIPERFRLAARKLATRTEAERTEIVCRVSGAAGEAQESFPIDILAFDQWPGVGHYPELTAAFVTPNHPRIAELLGSARTALRGLADSDALDGYQSASRQRVSLLAEATFNALAVRGIGYINPPASFETQGQRVRLVDRIAREGFGTCLDLSLLIISMWEQCGLHPLLLLPHGHAMPAVWTHEAHLPEAAIDEPSRIRNLIELGEIIPLESTLITQPGVPFAAAVEAAKTRMREPGPAFCAIDIRSARKLGVRPLPLRDDGESGVDLDTLDRHASAAAAQAADSTLDRVALADRAEQAQQRAPKIDKAESTSDRIARWQTRLLDLTLNNRLLHVRKSSRCIPLLAPRLAALEDALADGARLTLLPKADTSEPYLQQQLESLYLHTDESDAETQKRLLDLYRIAKSSIEETGANVLYLALGLLKWFESESSDQPRFAPLILLPITLTRAAGGSGYRYSITLSDEPLRPNVTLLEKLRVEFGIEAASLEDLPEDERGLDVELILRNFRSAIRQSPRWEVIESAAIGLFSFNKFLMWKDLKDNIGRLKGNRLVGHLVDRPDRAFDSEPFPRPEDLDEQVKPGELFCTRDADSSQLAAVQSAADGRSFVLEGPPGTGKSQTIANIIAHSLTRGRRVLFVAEKMAALSVVRSRLEQDGLGPFCLELHSAKASKKEVLAQLEQALAVASNAPPQGWDALCRDLATTRDQLNAYVREMHRPRATGESLYRMLGRLSLLDDGPTCPPPANPAAATQDQLDAWKATVAELQQRGVPVDPVDRFPLRGIGRSEWSFSLPDDAGRAIDRAAQAHSALQLAADRLLEHLKLAMPAASASRGAISALADAAQQLLTCPNPPRALLQGSEARALRARSAEAIAIGRARDAGRKSLLTRYREEFLRVEPLTHIDAIRRHLKQPAILRFFTAGKVKKPLRVYALTDLAPLPQVAADLEALSELNRLADQLARYTDVAACFSSAWHGADFDTLEQQVRWADAFSRVLASVEADPTLPGLAALLADAAASPDAAARVAQPARDFIAASAAWAEASESLSKLLVTTDAAFGDGRRDWLAAVAEVLTRWRTHLPQLNAWTSWRAVRDRAEAQGLSDLVALYERSGCSLADLDSVFWRSFGRAWFNAVADSVDAIRQFNADAHKDAIQRFRSLDSMSIRLTRGVVTAALSANAPAAPAAASSQSEMGILRRELEKKRRHLPTRRLIESMPTLLPRLKPCFLMSPLSVAQFLDASLPPFDLVVFDEASQIPVWDAIGAIARGTEVIVVGDSKQLPPTSFFSTIDGDADSDDHAIDDMESILKECNASGIPGLRLRWHYRSRHETLIAFSNHHYYHNELHTFPSPQERSERLGVTFRHVTDGVYDRGGSSTNRIEAQTVVSEVVRMLRDPEHRDSIGIVTFSQAQQTLIEDLLDEQRREHPEIERFFTSESHEPVFVKNLENVQGDERDAIIFSVGYGPDKHGKPSMNFGPLNQEGGERRLNVAVTRARRRLIVFSSLTSDQIDLRRTRSVGVKHFKTFLDYANRGPQAIAEAAVPSAGLDFESGFEKAVWRALTDRGYQVDTQIGCAGYRIDLAVRHPDKPGRYLLGIECDGAAYHSAKTARDRDRIRQAVLEGLGWRMERVWSTQWQVNPQGCIDKLTAAIEDALNAPPELVLPENRPPPTPPAPSTPPFAAAPVATATTAPPASSREVYTPAQVGDPRLAALDVYDASSATALVRTLAKIVQLESPITRGLAQRRLAEAFGLQRITERFRERFTETVDAAQRAGQVAAIDADLWSPSLGPGTFTGFRVPGSDENSQRDIEDIPLAEVSSAAAQTLAEQFGLPRDELIREVARLFGIKRVIPRVADRVNEAIDNLIAAGGATETNGTVQPRR